MNNSTKIIGTIAMIVIVGLLIASCNNPAGNNNKLTCSVVVGRQGDTARNAVRNITEGTTRLEIEWLSYTGNVYQTLEDGFQYCNYLTIVFRTGWHYKDGNQKVQWIDGNSNWFDLNRPFDFYGDQLPADDYYPVIEIAIINLEVDDVIYPFPRPSEHDNVQEVKAVRATFGENYHNINHLANIDYPDKFGGLTYDSTVNHIETRLVVDTSRINEFWEQIGDEWFLMDGKDPYELITIIGTAN